MTLTPEILDFLMSPILLEGDALPEAVTLRRLALHCRRIAADSEAEARKAEEEGDESCKDAFLLEAAVWEALAHLYRFEANRSKK